MKKGFNKYNIIGYFIFLAVGISIGWFLFHPNPGAITENHCIKTASKSSLWTCSVHPDVRSMKPGKCPICSRDLVPCTEDEDDAPIDTSGVFFTNESLDVANVQTVVVTRKNPVKEIRLYGKVQVNDRYKVNQTATIGGRIESLSVNSTGEDVKKGQTLALIYSPELVSAQQALLDAIKTKVSDPATYHAAKERLRRWNFNDDQIQHFEKQDRVINNFEVIANVSGVVTSKKVNSGEYVHKGEVLYQVADLSKLWVVFDAYESDLPFLNKGNQISFSFKSLSGTNFTTNISYIEPIINAETRTSKVRVELDNPSGRIKPDMFAIGLVQANLSEYRNKLVIPELSVLWTGKRSLVYVKQVGGSDIIFKLREVKLGPMLGNSCVVISGLSEGEEIVSQGVFNVSAVAKREKQTRY